MRRTSDYHILEISFSMDPIIWLSVTIFPFKVGFSGIFRWALSTIGRCVLDLISNEERYTLFSQGKKLGLLAACPAPTLYRLIISGKL